MITSDEPTPPPTLPSNAHDLTADARDKRSNAQDRSAEARDDLSDARDDRAEERDQNAGRVDADAAGDRAGAKRDRKASGGDRKHAEEDRDASFVDRVRAGAERADLVLDGPTGAHQRAHGVAELERDLVKARRTGQPFVLAFMDVDGLETIDDIQGHAARDEVLRQVVAAVRKSLREYDPVVRYGGNQLVCGLLDLTLDDASNRFAETTRDLASHGIALSVGLAGLDGNTTVPDLIARADEAVYEERKHYLSGAGPHKV